MHDQTTLK